MKKILYILFLCPFLLSADGSKKNDGINWVDFNTGFDRALTENLPVVIDCYTDWCHWCKVMDKKTFSDTSVINLVNEHFVAIKFNPEQTATYRAGTDSFASGRELLLALSKNRPSGYPTLFFFEPNGKKMYQVAGYQPVDEFKESLYGVLAIYNAYGKKPVSN